MEFPPKQVWQSPELIESDVAKVTLGGDTGTADGNGSGPGS
jgi:hypothetical protein